jgi:hypothetical protein
MNAMKSQDLPDPTRALGQQAQQLRYASVLGRSTWVGTVLLLLSFIVDVGGLLPPHVPHERLPDLWGLPVQRYVQLADWPTGWGWLALAGQGDLANLLGIALLCMCPAVCVLALLPDYVRRGDRAYVGFCMAELTVLLVAASGLLATGH